MMTKTYVQNRNTLGLIICTRNRPQFLSELLHSISGSVTKPRQVVLVSSGTYIENIVANYSETLNITHIHTEKVGQSNQKLIGISSLSENVNWVFFLDDDLLLMPDTINFALEKINQVTTSNVAGIGTQIVPLRKIASPKYSKTRNWPRNKLGVIKKSGRAITYQSTEEIETEWLNGASIWKKEVLNQYQLPILNSRYAAYEDVIFSTKVNETHKLIFEPRIKIIEQISHNNSKQSISAYSYINLWTGYFVCIDKRTRLSNFKVLVILRLLKFLFQQISLKNHQSKDSKLAFVLAWKLVGLPNDKVKSKEMILGLIKNQILN